jgi:pimeloyl-ACP methyl ester carboxylesterase
LRRIVLDAQSDGLEGTIARGRANSPTWAEEEFEPWAEAKLRVSRNFLDDPTRSGTAEEWRELLQRVKCPVLLVTSGPELGSIVTPDVAQEATRVLPSLQVVRLSGAGHYIRREQFEPFVRHVRDFLGRHALAWPKQATACARRPLSPIRFTGNGSKSSI